MKTFAVLFFIIVIGCFVWVLISQKKRYRYFGDVKKEKRVEFYKRYQGGEKLKPGDKIIFEELQKEGLVTSRGTDCMVSLTNKGSTTLAKEEFEVRCDLRARVQRLITLARGEFNTCCHLRRAHVK